jgi:hypothetical protein
MLIDYHEARWAYDSGSLAMELELTYADDADGRRTSSGGSLATMTLSSAVRASTTSYKADNDAGQVRVGEQHDLRCGR